MESAISCITSKLKLAMSIRLLLRPITFSRANIAPPEQQHVHLEPHVCITYLDEDDRLVIRTSTQVPFHIRRMVAPLINMPVKKIRVVKPRIGGGFGNKQEMILEDLCAHLTLATGRPVRMEYTRTQEFTSSAAAMPISFDTRSV